MPDRFKDVPAEVLEAAQRIWFAGLGAMVLAQEEGTRLADGTTRLFARLVEHGRELEKNVPSPLARVKDAAGAAEESWAKVLSMLDAQVAATLHRLGVPTRDEIAELTRRIEQLSASIDSLKSQGV
jgi:poly(hydroxyalkanoate) granule-associated protein